MLFGQSEQIALGWPGRVENWQLSSVVNRADMILDKASTPLVLLGGVEIHGKYIGVLIGIVRRDDRCDAYRNFHAVDCLGVSGGFSTLQLKVRKSKGDADETRTTRHQRLIRTRRRT